MWFSRRVAFWWGVLLGVALGTGLVAFAPNAHATQWSYNGATWFGSAAAACSAQVVEFQGLYPQWAPWAVRGTATNTECPWSSSANPNGTSTIVTQAGACTGLPGCVEPTSGPASNTAHDGCNAGVESFYSIPWPGSTTSPATVNIGGCAFSPMLSIRSSDGSSLVGISSSTGALFSGAAASATAQSGSPVGVRVVVNADGSVTTSTTVLVPDGAGGTMTQIRASTVPFGGGTASVVVTAGTGSGSPGGGSAAAVAAAAAALAAANAATAAAATQAAAALASGNANAVAAAAASSAQAAAALAAANAQSTAANASAIIAGANAAALIAGQCGGAGQAACKVDDSGTPTAGSVSGVVTAGKAALNALVPESFGVGSYVHGLGFSAWTGLPIIGGSDGCVNPDAFTNYHMLGHALPLDACSVWAPFKPWLGWFLWAGTAVFCYRRVARLIGGA